MGRARTRPELILDGDHDTMTESQKRSHYSSGCTHDACRRAISEYNAERQRRKRAELHELSMAALRMQLVEPRAVELSGRRVPARGASRRLQGLLFAGHSPVAIATRTRIGVDAIWWLLEDLVVDVDEVTHRIIDREFKKMRTEAPAPRAKSAADGDTMTLTCRALARKHQWASAWAWVDIDHDEKPTYRSEVAS